ncbi:hypothetical protein RA272_27675, partial [Pseudomonas syringae pv. tagetis]|uniref:hypothetical protein n=1 Tax=Pseudomonas syringae group genomosp. 7 TaxID=251699 RepID=UPI00376F7232
LVGGFGGLFLVWVGVGCCGVWWLVVGGGCWGGGGCVVWVGVWVCGCWFVVGVWCGGLFWVCVWVAGVFVGGVVVVFVGFGCGGGVLGWVFVVGVGLGVGVLVVCFGWWVFAVLCGVVFCAVLVWVCLLFCVVFVLCCGGCWCSFGGVLGWLGVLCVWFLLGLFGLLGVVVRLSCFLGALLWGVVLFVVVLGRGVV